MDIFQILSFERGTGANGRGFSHGFAGWWLGVDR
jgi:hypothetical protein